MRRFLASILLALPLLVGCENVLAPFAVGVDIIGPRYSLGKFHEPSRYSKQEPGYVCEFPLTARAWGGTAEQSKPVEWVGGAIEILDPTTGAVTGAVNLSRSDVQRHLGSVRSGRTSGGGTPLKVSHSTLPYHVRLRVSFFEREYGTTKDAEFNTKCLQTPP